MTCCTTAVVQLSWQLLQTFYVLAAHQQLHPANGSMPQSHFVWQHLECYHSMMHYNARRMPCASPEGGVMTCTPWVQPILCLHLHLATQANHSHTAELSYTVHTGDLRSVHKSSWKKRDRYASKIMQAATIIVCAAQHTLLAIPPRDRSHTTSRAGNARRPRINTTPATVFS